MTGKRIFCGRTFCFDYRKERYEIMAAKDYRAKLLGGVESLLRPKDAIFLLDDAACPGTITEVMYANSLGRTLHLFYVRHSDDKETESERHTPCWYPIQFCQMTNGSVNLYPCSRAEEATSKILSVVNALA